MRMTPNFTAMKFLRLLVIMLFVASSMLYAQERKFSINTNVLNLVARGPSLSLNYDMSTFWSIQLYGSAGSFNGIGYSYKTGIIDFKYHLSENMYVGPYLRYIEKTIYRPGFVDRTGFFSTPGRDFQGKGLSPGANFGFNIINEKRFNLESFIGIGYGKFISQRGDKAGSGFMDARIGVLTGVKF